MPSDITLRLVNTQVGVDIVHTVEDLLDSGKSERLLAGAEELRTFEPDSVVWACTSGSFVYGYEGAQKQAAEVGEALHAAASSTSLAFVNAIRALGLKRVAIAATYPEDLAKHFRTFLEDAGLDVVSLVSNDIASAALAGELDEAGVINLAKTNNPDNADVVLLPDTAMHSVRFMDHLEKALGKPVLAANQVTLWEGLRLANRTVPIPSMGTLFNPRTQN
jgi:maleate cis-trans isomerase